jgi:WD40 repeat protein
MAPMIRYITGDECGVMKESLPIPRVEKLDVTGGDVKLLTPIDQMARTNGIVDMKWFSHDDIAVSASSSALAEKSFGVLLQDGRVQEYSMTTTTTTTSTTDIAPSATKTKKAKHGTYQLVRECPKLYYGDNNDHEEVALGLHHFATSRKVCVISTQGRMSIFDPKQFADDDDDVDVEDDEEILTTTSRDGIVKTFHAFQDDKKKEKKENNAGAHNAVAKNSIVVTAHASNPVDEGYVAVGGKEREMVLYDLNVAGNGNNGSSSIVWKAKNLPPDPQTLLHPLVYPTAACFMSRNTLVVGTAYHQVRVYDVRMSSSSSSPQQQQQQRRPVSYSPFDESLFAHRITALCPQQPVDSHVVYVGDSAGYLSTIDIRMLKGGAILREKAHTAMVGRYVGPSGSIRTIQCSADHRTLACVGLDRMLRIFDVKSRRQIHAIYLKQRVNCLLLAADETEDTDALAETQQPYDSDDDDDDDGAGGVFSDKVEDYVGSSSDDDDGDSEDDANPFNDDDDEDDEEEEEDSPPKKRRT